MKWTKAGMVCGLGVGPILLIGGAIIGGLWFNIFDYVLSTQLILTRTSRSFGLWKETPLPMYIDIYMFNWTNPVETLSKGAKPKFTEMGPYVFSEHHTKVNLHWNENGTVTFQQVRKWHFVSELSNGSLSDEVTNINVVAMTIGAMVSKKVPKEFFKVINIVINYEESALYVTRTVRELLFDGYYDPVLNLTTKLERFIKIDLPFDKFGWFYNRNMSKDYDGIFNMYTGSSSFSQLGNLFAWNHQTKTSFFNGSCSQVKGTTGELWPPKTTDNNNVEVFANDICSSVSLLRSVSVTHGNLVGRKYIGTKEAFDNGTVDPSMACYCIKEPCQPSGTRDLSSCRYGAPAFVSYPHFYLADPVYRQNVSGMKPSESKHGFVAVLHEETAIPLNVSAKLQVNIYVEPIEGLRFYHNLPVAYFPQIWFNQRAEITKEMTSELQPLIIFHNVGQPLFFTFCGIGVVLVLCGIILWFRKYRNNSKNIIVENSN